MCMLIIKPEGVELPSHSRLENSYLTNRDGAGFAYCDGDDVVIQKGYYDLVTFEAVLRNTIKKEAAAMIHFRAATSGKRDAGNCHPFPVCEDVKLLRSTQLRFPGIVMAHNGVLSGWGGKKLSDTMEFIQQVLSDKVVCDNLFESHGLQYLLEEAINSDRMAFLAPNGRCIYVGEFIDEDDGCLYSNSGYLERRWGSSLLPLPGAKNIWGFSETNCEFCGASDALWNRNQSAYLCKECELWMETSEASPRFCAGGK